MELAAHIIGLRCPHVDHSGDWASLSEISDTGCLLVRPDHHICWRVADLPYHPETALTAALRKILAR